MANIHRVIQIKPDFHNHGAAISIKPLFFDQFEKEYHNWKVKDVTELQCAKKHVMINNVNVNYNYYDIQNKELYLIVTSGASWGYQEKLTGLLDNFAKYTEDTLFFVTDEDDLYVDKFEIKKGRFTYKRLIASNGDIIKCIEKSITNKEVLYELYLCEAQEYDLLKEGFKLLNKAIKIAPDKWKAYYEMGYAFNEIKEYKKAIKNLKQALKVRRDRIKMIDKFVLFEKDEDEGLSTAYKNIYLSLGFAYSQLGEYKQAIECFDKSYHIIPRRDNYQPLLNKSISLINQNKLNEGIKCCDEVIKNSKNIEFIADAYYNKACAYSKKGNTEKALENLKLSVVLDKDNKKNAKKEKYLKSLWDNKKFKKIIE